MLGIEFLSSASGVEEGSTMNVIPVLFVGIPFILLGVILVTDFKGVRNFFARGSDKENTSDVKYHAPIIAGGIFLIVAPSVMIADAVVRQLF
ncbi:hypothetical protein ACFRQM_07950 [Streptomyces sp. NPDC056831]|uniref:hypothetical protein n=1 Tax=Streptomyces sp. NPDC056831 TaxID=3345954 RepID=UPI0036AD36ED